MPEDDFNTDLEWPNDPFAEPRASETSPPRPEADDVPEVPRSPLSPDELDRIAEVVAAALQELRAHVDLRVDDLRSELVGLQASVDRALDRPVETIASTGAGVPSLDPILKEIDRVREEVTSLKRRISLRVAAPSDAVPADPAVLTDEQLDRLAKTVAGLLRRDPERSR